MVGLFNLCLGPWGEIARWPDGGALLDQPVKLVDAFATIMGVKARYTKKAKSK